MGKTEEMNRTGFELLQSSKNQFHNHLNLFLDDKIVLPQLENMCNAWVIKHEDSYRERPLPTEPMQYRKASNDDFKQVMKAWHLGCRSMEMENKSNAWRIKESKKFFLKAENNYEEGTALFDKHAELEKIPF